MRDDHLASIASAISMKSLHESDTCTSLETIPFLSTHRKDPIGPASLGNEEDELLKELINIESEPNCEAADSSLLLLANEWEQQQKEREIQSKANTGVFFFSDIGDEDSGI